MRPPAGALRPVLPLALAALLAACAAAEVAETTTAPPVERTTTTTSAPTTTTTAPSTTVSTTSTTTAPETTTTTALTAESVAPDRSLAARADEPLEVFAAPGDPEPLMVLSPTTDLGTPRVVRVLEGPRDGWMRVSLPVRPNGSEGWIAEADAVVFVLDRKVEIDLDDRTLRVVSRGETLLDTTVAVGGSDSPTPVGSFYVTDSVIVGDPNGPWGPHAFGLSAFSDTITEFNGGDGIIGIHGTNRPSSIGHAQSLGCVRVPNEVALELAGLISAGVVVDISA